jgi:hypothetical protein
MTFADLCQCYPSPFLARVPSIKVDSDLGVSKPFVLVA